MKYEDVKIGKIKPLRGKVHAYLGMTLDVASEGVVKIKTLNYVSKMLDAFYYPKEIAKEVVSPASENLYKIDEKSEKLDAKRAQEFHNMVAKGLFLTKRARPDLMTAIAFLCTRVQAPTVGDWSKLIRLLRYLNGTRDLFMTLRADDTTIVKWYGDGLFAVHNWM